MEFSDWKERYGFWECIVSTPNGSAIFSLRAVKTPSGKFLPMIRTSIDTGELLDQGIMTQTLRDAVFQCYQMLELLCKPSITQYMNVDILIPNIGG